MTVLYWIRQDLRLTDNPALTWATQQGPEQSSVLPVYIYDDTLERQPGAASKCWLHESLKRLNQTMSDKIAFFKGDPKLIIPEILEQTGIKTIVWNRIYEPEAIARDSAIKRDLQAKNIEVKSFNGSLLWQPTEVLKKDGTPYKVFTPLLSKRMPFGSCTSLSISRT